MSQRSAFVLHVRPERIDDYVAAHQNVWPEMLEALRAAGIRNYSIFRDGNQVFGYFEADDLEAARGVPRRAAGLHPLAGQHGRAARQARARDRAAAARGELPPGLNGHRARAEGVRGWEPNIACVSEAYSRTEAGLLAWTDRDIIQPIQDFQNPKQEWRRLVSELYGTFLLVIVAA